MLLENNRDTLAKAVYMTMESVDEFLNYIKADGACEEGPSYWGHAPGKTLEDYISYGKENYAGNMLYIQSDNQIIMINLVTGEKKMIHSDN